MKKLLIIILISCPLLNLNAKSRYVILKKGETLWRISHIYKVPLETLKKINKIKDTSKVYAGRKIYLPSTAKSSSKKSTSLRSKLKLNQPVKGRILNQFNEGQNLVQKNGIEYKTSRNAKVVSASPGVVKYTGNMKGYGNVVIIRHSSKISMIYANLNTIYVKTGQKIGSNKTIGLTGRSNLNKDYVLHFELLSNGKPINPKYYFQK